MAFKDYLTVEGERLLAKSIAGGQSINITKVVLGTGYLPDGASSKNMTNVIMEHTTLNVQSVSTSGDNVVISAHFDNTDLQEGFYLREKGIYMSVDNEEVLAIYGNAGSTAEYIDTPDVCVVEKTIRTVLQLTSEEMANVTLTAQGMSLSDVYKEKVSGADATGDIAASQNAVYYVYRDLSEQIREVSLKTNTAQETADTAQETADEAVSKADTAQGTADTAVSKADTAQGTANTAVSKADTAQGTADEAVSKADKAQKTADEASAIAKGKNQSEVFDTTEDMYAWLSDEANKGLKNIGDNLYIEDKGVPDWWIAEVLEEPNEDGRYYEIAQLETQKVDLKPINDAIDDLDAVTKENYEYFDGEIEKLEKSPYLFHKEVLLSEFLGTKGQTFSVYADSSFSGSPNFNVDLNSLVPSGADLLLYRRTWCLYITSLNTRSGSYNTSAYSGALLLHKNSSGSYVSHSRGSSSEDGTAYTDSSTLRITSCTRQMVYGDEHKAFGFTIEFDKDISNIDATDFKIGLIIY